jgi:hypothetical protein
LRRVSAAQPGTSEEVELGEACFCPLKHFVGQIEAGHGAFRPDGFCERHEAVSSAETDFQNAFSGARSQQLQSRLAHGGFATFGQQIIDAADFVVKRSGLVFRLENPQN